MHLPRARPTKHTGVMSTRRLRPAPIARSAFADHGRLKVRLRSMRGLEQDRSARVILAGHAFVQNLRRGHYELAVEEPVNRRLMVAFDELALVI